MIPKQQMQQIIQFVQTYVTYQLKNKTKLVLNPFDDKRVYPNQKKSLPWDIHKQQGDCPCLFCLKFILLYHKELTEICKTDEENYLNVWYWKKSTHQELLKLKSDRGHLLCLYILLFIYKQIVIYIYI